MKGLFAVVGLMLLAGLGQAAEAGDWWVRVGATLVDPKSDNHDLVEVDSATMLTFNGTYKFHPNWGVELLAALPFEHDVELVSGGKVGEVKHLPPTLSVQYHFAPDAAISPYVGAGVNWTMFFSEDTTGALEGASLSLKDSVGLALQGGVDISVTERWFVNLDVRYIDIDTKAKVDGVSIGTVKIDPWTFGVNVGYRF